MTAREFAAGYAERFGLTSAEFDARLEVWTCNCGELDCDGWQLLPRNASTMWKELERASGNRPATALDDVEISNAVLALHYAESGRSSEES